MKRLFVISLIILSFVSFLINWTFVEGALSQNAQLKILNSTNANYVCTYYGESVSDDDFYYMNKSLSLKSKNEKIVAEILMYKADKSYTIQFFKRYASIKNDEMVVSKNVSNKYGLNIGDTIIVNSSLYDNHFEYKIKEIIEPAYCFIEEYFVEDKGIVILGNSSALIESNNLSMAFIDEDEDLGGVALQKLNSLGAYKKALRKAIFVDFGVVIGISCFMLIAYFVLFETIISFRIRGAVINGESPKNIFKRYYANPILWSILYSFLMIVFVLAESLLLFKQIYVPLQLLMMLITPTVSVCLSLILMKIKLRKV